MGNCECTQGTERVGNLNSVQQDSDKKVYQEVEDSAIQISAHEIQKEEENPLKQQNHIQNHIEEKPVEQIPTHNPTEDFATPFVGDIISTLSLSVKSKQQELGQFDYDQQKFDDPDAIRLAPQKLHNQQIYHGTWKNGLRHGNGICYWQDGNVFEGYWKNDKSEGKGRLIHSDNDVYEGLWKDGKANGKGVYYHSDGTKYYGSWVNDQQEGQGEETFKDGSRYNGQYKNGKREGSGNFIWNEGGTYKGLFKDNCLEGRGVYTWSDGRNFNGQWRKNRMHGFGKYTFVDGTTYEGYYVDDIKEGYGNLTWTNGKSYHGNWKSGKQHGEGIYKTTDKIKKGVWENGKRKEWIDSDQQTLKQEIKQKQEEQDSLLNEIIRQEKIDLDNLKNSDQQEDDSFEDKDEVMSQSEIVALTNKNKTNNRTSVSAEVYGQFNKKEAFVPIVIEKDPDATKKISERLGSIFMFQSLSKEEQEIVVKAMSIKNYAQGDKIINQGEDGEELYVIDQGQLDCYKRLGQDKTETYLKTYNQGEIFGELALLYNAPRAATIIVKSDKAICFLLDRRTFNHIVKESAIQKRNKYEEFLKQVQILKEMDDYERSQIADCLKPIQYKTGDVIVREGEIGSTFYIIESGTCDATRLVDNTQQKVKEYQSGDYFGELALLREDSTRQANIKATSNVQVCAIDRSSFSRLLGNLTDILKRNTTSYEHFNKQ